MKHIIGKPLYKRDDIVSFDLEGETCTGKIYIVDAYGTVGQNEEPSYDVMVENFRDSGNPCLVKHIRESALRKI